MSKFVNMFSFFYARALTEQEPKNSEKEEKEEDFEIIENVYSGPGGIDKIFEWHNKNKLV